MKLLVTDQNGEQHSIDGSNGMSVMEIIRSADLEIAAQCGGCCGCATCHVYIDADWINKLPPPDGDEEDMLELAMEADERSRLSCKIFASDELEGLALRLAPGTQI